jgi:hypothetical protein
MGKDIELLLLKKDVQEKLDSLGAIQVKDLPATTCKVVEYVAGTIDLGYLHDFDRPLTSKMSRRKTVDSQDAFDNDEIAVKPQTSTIETQTDPELTNLKTSEENSSGSSSSDNSDDSSDEGDDSDKESDADDKSTSKAKHSEAGVQTDYSTIDTTKIDGSTMTDPVVFEPSVPDARSQGQQAVFAGNDSADDANDNSLAARRRRRRERAQTAYFSQENSSNGSANETEQYSNDINFTGTSGMSLMERRKLRAAYAMNHHSLDGDEVFYDATSTKNH